MMKALQALGLAVFETALFLDSHPNNQRALEFYRKNAKAYMALKDRYTSLYGPLTLGDSAGESWMWVDTPWPWQNQEA